MPSSESSAAGTASAEDSSFYKTQYEQLEAELADFQSSSRELEAELERDIEAAEKRERHLQEKIESLTYEVEEWKVCFLTFAQQMFKMKLLLTLPMYNRANTSNPRPRRTVRRMRFRRRSRPYERPTGQCNSSSGT